MKKIFSAVAALLLLSVSTVKAQDLDSAQLVNQALQKNEFNAKPIKKDKTEKVNRYAGLDLSKRVIDHLIIQWGSAYSAGASDSTDTKGLSTQFNIAFMIDKPFKSDPHYSLGIGLGFGGTSLRYKNKYLNLSTSASTVEFQNVTNSSTNRYKVMRLITNFIELPIELRFSQNAINPSNGWKGAIGIKPGLMVSSYAKYKNAIDASGNTLYGNGYTRTDKNGRFFRSFKADATARVGYGAFSIFGTYSLMSVFTGNGPSVKPFAIGLMISGL